MSKGVALWILLTLPGQAVSAQCPSTRYNLYNWSNTFSPLPTGLVSVSNPYYPPGGQFNVAWNAPLGALSVSGYSPGYDSGAFGVVATTDDFEILGALPGVVVRVTARLEAGGTSDSGPFYYADFSGALSDAAGRYATPVTDANGTRGWQFPVDFVAGNPQRLTYQLSGDATNTSMGANASLRFPDLPVGISIVSCRGFQTGSVTPTRGDTWGRLKSLYR